MDALLMLLNKYSLIDPVGSNGVGVFANTTLQTLYNQLVTQGNASVVDAYKVGATIEDLDIFDLKTALISIDNQDIRLVYDMLTKGSRNHMRSFYKNILNVGGTYTPLYITQAEFDAIINSAMETRINQTQNKDIVATYNYLKMASENHLRAFVRRLKMQGINYEPVILNKNEFNKIIAAENNKGGHGGAARATQKQIANYNKTNGRQELYKLDRQKASL